MLTGVTRAISAIAAAAAIAGALTVLPGTSDPVSASSPLNSGKGDRLDIRISAPDCSLQAWPYYQAGCVKDGRQTLGRAKDPRVVTTDRLPEASIRR